MCGMKRKFFCFHLQRRRRSRPLLSEIKPLYAQLVLKNNAEQFYACYFGSCVLNAVDFIKGLSVVCVPTATVIYNVGLKSWLKYLLFKKKDLVAAILLTQQIQPPIADCEIGAPQFTLRGML